MPFRAAIAHFMLSVMFLIQGHAAIPHVHVTLEGGCGAVCHTHDDCESSLVHTVWSTLHDWVHQHAATSDCQGDEEHFAPVAELEAASEMETTPALHFKYLLHPARFVQPAENQDPLLDGHKRRSLLRGPPEMKLYQPK